MLNVQCFTFGPFQENTYIISNLQQQCWIVDPGMNSPAENNTVLDYINKNSLKPIAIINTHGHIDHILGVSFLKDIYNIPFYLHAKDQFLIDNAAASAAMFGLRLTKTPIVDGRLNDADVWKLGDEELVVSFTPGHSPGSVVFYYAPGNWVISGDVLFAGSIGRTDLPGGDFQTLINSIKTRLFILPENTKVYSGHGPATTIKTEVEHNPFFQLD